MARRSLTPADMAHGRAIGALLAQARTDRGWSGGDLAARSGISLDSIRSIEGGRIATPSFLTVGRLAEALDVDLTWLYRQAEAAARKAG